MKKTPSATSRKIEIPITFTEFFGITQESLRQHGAFDVSLISDLPLFVDPFLLFHSEKDEYQELHLSIVRYVTFLRKSAPRAQKSIGLMKEWFYFPEVKQNWFGYSKVGNDGHGLGKKFADTLNHNFQTVLKNFGESAAEPQHIEKVCLFKEGAGRDAVSDFVTNLLHGYLAKYTEIFATQNLPTEMLRDFVIVKAEFDYNTETWKHKKFRLPVFRDDYVLLTPVDILTKDETWINFPALKERFIQIIDSLDSDQLRSRINAFLSSVIPDNPKAIEISDGYKKTLSEFPEIADQFTREREQEGYRAAEASIQKVTEANKVYIEKAKKLAHAVSEHSSFYDIQPDSLAAAKARALFLKSVIEDQDGYRIFYHKGSPIRREKDLQILFKLTWFASAYDANSEVNNGRGPVDFKVSYGSKEAALVEFKLASNTALKKNLKNQIAVYEKANRTAKSLKVILYFTVSELNTTKAILTELDISSSQSVILIDARSDNKPSASTTTSH